MTPRMQKITQQLSSTEIGMITKGLDTEAQKIFGAADGRKYAGDALKEKRHHLRRMARRYLALAREFEEGLL